MPELCGELSLRRLFSVVLALMHFIEFTYKNAHYRIASDKTDVITESIRGTRRQLEDYIAKHPHFAAALTPLPAPPPAGAPEIVRRLDAASRKTDVGPMAAVAGTVAAMACEAAAGGGAEEAVVDNGGDIFIGRVRDRKPLYIGIYASAGPSFRELAFKIEPADIPLAVCSSSSMMGHSISFGKCDLATVFSPDAALADAAATAACNSVLSADDIEKVLQHITEIAGISGAVIIKGEHFGMAGTVPELVRHRDPELPFKVTKASASNFPG
jgi:uncharacterized protein